MESTTINKNKPEPPPAETAEPSPETVLSAATTEPPEELMPPVAAKPKRRRVRIKKSWIVLPVLVVAAVAAFLYLRDRFSAPVSTDIEYTYAQAELRDITATLSGSGTLQPADSYTVTTLVSGEILSAGFEEGDMVQKGDVLYEIDSSAAATSIQRSELSLAQTQRSYNKKVESQADLTVSSPISGVITGISVQVGDTVGTQSAIATVEETSKLTLTEYYSDEYAGQIYAGMSATVSVPGQMLSLAGTVKEVSSLKRVSETGVSCFAVTIEVSNPGSLTIGTTATCWLTSGAEEIYPSISDDDGLDASAQTKIYCGVSGTVASINVRNNETISAGQVVMMLSSDTLSDEIQSAADSLKDAQLSLNSQYNSLDDYTITAPIDGTIIDKYYKQGEKSESGRSLCIIYDLSHLTLTMDVDELDIHSVSVGQTAVITADAVSGASYTGVITKVGINGTASGGVTTYPVTIRIDETDGLLPGMNVDVVIITDSRSGALSIPSAAVSRGNSVLVQTKDGSTGVGAPEGYEYVIVETGIADSDYVEITSGLGDGDTVAYIPDTASGDDIMMMMFNGGGATVIGGDAVPNQGGAYSQNSGGGGFMP